LIIGRGELVGVGWESKKSAPRKTMAGDHGFVYEPIPVTGSHETDTLTLSRVQFAMTIMFHFLFGLALYPNLVVSSLGDEHNLCVEGVLVPGHAHEPADRRWHRNAI
jgi:hypothetical protein